MLFARSPGASFHSLSGVDVVDTSEIPFGAVTGLMGGGGLVWSRGQDVAFNSPEFRVAKFLNDLGGTLMRGHHTMASTNTVVRLFSP